MTLSIQAQSKVAGTGHHRLNWLATGIPQLYAEMATGAPYRGSAEGATPHGQRGVSHFSAHNC